MKKINAALVGNPNSGKTCIFNQLTGTHQHTGNYPGVTVQIAEGKLAFGDYEINFVDLPGTYSLTAFSDEELVTRNYIIENQPDVVINIVDASNIERNLYLTTQLIEIDVPLVLAFNMSDIARDKGLVFDLGQLSKLLEADIVETVGSKNIGKEQLLQAIVRTYEKPKEPRKHQMKFGSEIEDELGRLAPLIAEYEPALAKKYHSRWLAIKLLEQDTEIESKITEKKVKDAVAGSVEHLSDIFADAPHIVIADRRYGFISGACQETIQSTVEMRHNISDAIDTVVTHRFLGLPIFLALMFVAFWLTFKIGKFPMDWLEIFFHRLSGLVAGFFPAGDNSLLKSLLVDGIISGVGGVIVFLPNILLLFLAIAFLEDTGYMARAAFVMDRFMHKIGLHGKSFIPMLIGFGCTVPAIMATRILENKRSRLTTILVLPLFSCGAKLTIYSLLIPAFFPAKWQGPVLWLIYIIGIVTAVILAKVLRLSIFRGETTDFVMELPPYRVPVFKSLAIHMWQRGWLFLKKAGTVILAVSIIFWAMMNFPRPAAETLENLSVQEAQQKQIEYSVVGRIGSAIEPAIKPLGFDWKIGTALIGAAAAKEIFVSQLSIVYAVSDTKAKTETFRQKLQENYTPLQGFCVMLFCLIATPCIATIAATKIETNTWRWPILQFTGLTVLAYVMTLIVYQAGLLVMR